MYFVTKTYLIIEVPELSLLLIINGIQYVQKLGKIGATAVEYPFNLL
jgi:hypothetical protein